jgi:transcriptional regulator with XRE-family HTH domain
MDITKCKGQIGTTMNKQKKEVYSLPYHNIDIKLNVYEIFGINFKKYLKSNRILITDVVKKMDINSNSLAMIFKGEYFFNKTILNSIKNHYDVDTKDIDLFLNSDNKEISYKKFSYEVTFGVYVGHFIKNFRKNNGYNVLQFSKFMVWDNGFISKVESGKYDTVSLPFLYALCKATDTPSSHFLNF